MSEMAAIHAQPIHPRKMTGKIIKGVRPPKGSINVPPRLKPRDPRRLPTPPCSPEAEMRALSKLNKSKIFSLSESEVLHTQPKSPKLSNYFLNIERVFSLKIAQILQTTRRPSKIKTTKLYIGRQIDLLNDSAVGLENSIRNIQKTRRYGLIKHILHRFKSTAFVELLATKFKITQKHSRGTQAARSVSLPKGTQNFQRTRSALNSEKLILTEKLYISCLTNTLYKDKIKYTPGKNDKLTIQIKLIPKPYSMNITVIYPLTK